MVSRTFFRAFPFKHFNSFQRRSVSKPISTLHQHTSIYQTLQNSSNFEIQQTDKKTSTDGNAEDYCWNNLM